MKKVKGVYNLKSNGNYKGVVVDVSKAFEKETELNDYFESGTKINQERFKLVCPDQNIQLLGTSGRVFLELFNIVLDRLLGIDLIIKSELNIIETANEHALRNIFNYVNPKYLHLGSFKNRGNMLYAHDFTGITHTERSATKISKMNSGYSKYVNLLLNNCFGKENDVFVYDKPIFNRSNLDFQSCL